jgi:hypothetical protein
VESVSQANGVTTATTTAQTTTTTEEDTTTTTEEVTTTTAVVSHKWGAAVEAMGLRVTVSKPYTDESAYVGTNDSVNEAWKVMVIEVTIENIGDQDWYVRQNQFSLFDASDERYLGGPVTIGFAGNAAAAKYNLPETYFSPGEKIHGYVYYDMPKEAVARSIWYYPTKDWGVMWGSK